MILLCVKIFYNNLVLCIYFVPCLLTSNSGILEVWNENSNKNSRLDYIQIIEGKYSVLLEVILTIEKLNFF